MISNVVTPNKVRLSFQFSRKKQRKCVRRESNSHHTTREQTKQKEKLNPGGKKPTSAGTQSGESRSSVSLVQAAYDSHPQPGARGSQPADISRCPRDTAG